MYYVEARFRDSDRVERFNLLQSSDAVVAWVSRNVASGMVLEVFVPSSAHTAISVPSDPWLPVL